MFCNMLRPAWDAAVSRQGIRNPVLEVDSELLRAMPTGSSPLLDSVRSHPKFVGVPFIAAVSTDRSHDVQVYAGDRSATSLLSFCNS
jgi:hypothetical protein